jgi:hypothetical protein
VNYVKGICTSCQKEDYIVKKLPKRKLCNGCNKKRLQESKGDKGKPSYSSIKKKFPKPSGQLALFEAIWSTRPHVSYISGERLGDDLKAIYCFHILGKGAFPKYKLYDKNIILTTAQEHIDWGEKNREELLALSPNWQKVFDLYDSLKEEYFNSL